MAKIEFPDLMHTDEMFLSELNGTISDLTNAHKSNPKELYPYDIADDMREAIESDDPLARGFSDEPIDPALLDALYVNLITEDGLPFYTSTFLQGLDKNHAFFEWVCQWTAEEGRHGPAIANYLYFTGQFDMHELEDGRMANMTNPDTPQPASFIEKAVYPSIQEPATEISHRNTMRLLPKSHRLGRRVIGQVVGDEVKHGDFNQGLVTAALEVDASTVVIATAKQIKEFAMPGKSIPGFVQKSEIIENLGIFGLEQLLGIYVDLVHEKWKLNSIEKLTPEAEAALGFINKKIGLMEKVLARRKEAAAEAKELE